MCYRELNIVSSQISKKFTKADPQEIARTAKENKCVYQVKVL